MEIDYATGEDYANFNNVTFFTGDVLTAYYDAGYDFQATFQSVEKGTVVSSAVTREEVLNSYNYDILILEEPIEVKVPATSSTPARMWRLPAKIRQEWSLRMPRQPRQKARQRRKAFPKAEKCRLWHWSP